MQPSGPEAANGAGADAASRSTQWHWALLLVACLHLLTTAGAWYVTDHAEYLFVARRLLDQGTLELAEPGVQRIAMLPWLVPGRGDVLRTRLLPATALTLVPLLAADRALGIEDPRQFGRLVHLQGHLFVLAGLFLLGRAVRHAGGSDAAAAIAVALTGLCWPVWLVARRIGPEPILLFLVCVWLAAVGRGRRAIGTRTAVCALLPWVSPTGPVIGATLAAAAVVDAWVARHSAPEGLREAVWPFGGLAAGIASLLLAWNHLYHGDWWLGGYAPYYVSLPPFTRDLVWTGLGVHLRALVLEAPVILGLAGLVLGSGRAPRTGGFTIAAALTAALLAMFAPFHQPEPARRLAVVWPCWGFVVGRGWDRLRVSGPTAQSLLAAAFLVGFYWLVRNEGRQVPGPGGLFYPNILWVKLLLAGDSPWWLIPVAALSTLLLVSAARTSRLLRLPAPSGQA